MRILFLVVVSVLASSCAHREFRSEEERQAYMDNMANAFNGAAQSFQQRAPQNTQQNCYYTPNGTGGYLINCTNN